MAKAKRRPAEFQPRGIEIGSMRQENPNWSRDHDGRKDNPRYIQAAMNLRESAVVSLYARGHIDEAQHKAAEEFRRLFETLGGVGARAIDYSREFVDGGRFPEPIGDRQIDAGKKLAAAYEALTKAHGLYAWKIVGYVCGEGRSISELTETKRQRLTMTDNLRTYLDCLCAHWQLAPRGIDTVTVRGQNQPPSEKCK